MWRTLRPLAWGLVLLAAPSPVSAQPRWLLADDRSALELEALKPFIEGLDESFATSTGVIRVRKVFSGGRALLIEAPFTHARTSGLELHYGFDSTGSSVDSTAFTRSESRFWNPFVGFEFGSADGTWRQELGVRIPTSRNDRGFPSELIGLAADIERPTAFASNITSLELALHRRPPNRRGLGQRWRLGVTAGLPTSTTGSFYYFTPRGMLVAAWDRWRVESGLVASLLSTSGSSPSLADRSWAQSETMIQAMLGPVRPTLILRFWLDEDEREVVPWVAGMSVAWVP